MVTVILQNPACLKKRIKLVLQLRQMLEKEHLLCVKISCVVLGGRLLWLLMTDIF